MILLHEMPLSAAPWWIIRSYRYMDGTNCVVSCEIKLIQQRVQMICNGDYCTHAAIGLSPPSNQWKTISITVDYYGYWLVCCQIFPIGRYQGQMQHTLTLREEGQRAELSPQGSKTTGGINHVGQPGWVTFPETQVLLHRGRLAGLWVSLAQELMAGKSNSQSTHRANWVPVFVWDDGEGVLPPSAPTSLRLARRQSVAH